LRQSVDITVHQKIHSRERPSESEVGGKFFVPKLSIVHHQIIHMEVKPVILVVVACDLAKELSSVHMKGFTLENGLMHAAKDETICTT
jgi:hypothetical protein